MDYKPTSRRLSEISHLFLSDVRKKQTDGTTPPTRTPPSSSTNAWTQRPNEPQPPAPKQPTPKQAGQFRGDLSVDLTPEEFADMMRPASAAVFKPARIVLAHHLGEAMADRVRDLAITLGQGRPVGVIYSDLSGVRVSIAESAHLPAEECPAEPFNAQRFRETLVELDQDVSEWLIVLPEPRTAEAAELLAHTAHWTLLAGADHDNVVAAYRTLKGVIGTQQPEISVSIFGAESAEDVDRTARKLASVCQQFLKVSIQTGPAVLDCSDVNETCVMDALADNNGHWQVLSALASGAAAPEVAAPAVAPVIAKPAITQIVAEKPSIQVTLPKISPEPVAPAAAVAKAVADHAPVMRMVPATSLVDHDAETILDLLDADATPEGILRSVLRGGGEYVESPVHPPMLQQAAVAVGRDRRLTLIVVAKPGMMEFRTVATALRWMIENRTLIAMAVPQLAIDTSTEPALNLIVDHADASADALQPLLAAGSVKVTAYRKVRWSGRTGLLLQAA